MLYILHQHKTVAACFAAYSLFLGCVARMRDCPHPCNDDLLVWFRVRAHKRVLWQIKSTRGQGRKACSSFELWRWHGGGNPELTSPPPARKFEVWQHDMKCLPYCFRRCRVWIWIFRKLLLEMVPSTTILCYFIIKLILNPPYGPKKPSCFKIFPEWIFSCFGDSRPTPSQTPSWASPPRRWLWSLLPLKQAKTSKVAVRMSRI